MNSQPSSAAIGSTLEALETKLTSIYGGIVGGGRLTSVLGYPSQAAFRQALARGRVPVDVFAIEGRRGKFARVADIAAWLHGMPQQGCVPDPARGLPKTGRSP